jgi:hypothetical protein
LAADKRHDIRDQFIAFLPSLIYRSQVPRCL